MLQEGCPHLQPDYVHSWTTSLAYRALSPTAAAAATLSLAPPDSLDICSSSSTSPSLSSRQRLPQQQYCGCLTFHAPSSSSALCLFAALVLYSYSRSKFIAWLRLASGEPWADVSENNPYPSLSISSISLASFIMKKVQVYPTTPGGRRKTRSLAILRSGAG